MKFIKIFGFLGIIFFAFSTKIVIGQISYKIYPLMDYPVSEKNYENDFKQISKIILVEPNPKITFSGFRGQRVSLKRIARNERRVKQMIKEPIDRLIGKVIPVIDFNPDSTIKVQIQNFIKKVISNLDSIRYQQDSLFLYQFDANKKLRENLDSIKNRQFFEKNKINCSLPLAIDSIKETNYIFFTYYKWDIITGTSSKPFATNKGRGTGYILLVNIKDKTVCYLNDLNMQPFMRMDNFYLRQALSKLKDDIKNCQNKKKNNNF